MIIIGKQKPAPKPSKVLVLGKPKLTSIPAPAANPTTVSKSTDNLPLSGGVPAGRGGSMHQPGGVPAGRGGIDPTAKTPTQNTDQLLDRLFVQRQDLYVQRAKLSNYYATLERKAANREECQTNYQEIEAYTRLMASISTEITYVERYGKSSQVLPEDNEGIRLKIQGLKNKRRSLVNRISKRNVKIRLAKTLGKTAQVQSLEIEVSNLERQRLEILNDINALENGA